MSTTQLQLHKEKIQTLEAKVSESTVKTNDVEKKSVEEIKKINRKLYNVQRDMRTSQADIQLQDQSKVSWNWLVIISVIFICIVACMLHVMKQQIDSNGTSADFESKLSAAHKDDQIQIAAFQNELHRLFQAAYLNGVEFNRSIYDLWNECKDSYCNYTKIQQETIQGTIIATGVAFNISYIHRGYSVYDFTLTKFTKWQLKDKQGNWYSEPFYSHPGGYLFQLNICTNGYGDDYGVYMTIYFRLLDGDYDNKLEWPVFMAARVQLLNRLGDHTHHERKSTHMWRKNSQGDHGGEIVQFFKIIELGLNAEKNTQYLKEDYLQVRVYFKTT